MEIDKYVHSYSSASSFMDNKSGWILKYLLKHRFPTYPAFGRGLSAEFGAYVKLKRMSQFKETKDLIHIDACIWVEKDGQKSIVIGKNGKVLKEIGRLARIDLEILFNKKVNLKTWVKIKNNWLNSKTILKEFGY